MGLFNALDNVKAVANDAESIIAQFHQSPNDKQKNALAAQAIANQLPLAQLAINNAEAQSRSWFVSGWRPAMMWGCLILTLVNVLITWCDQTFGLHVSNFGGGMPENIIMGALTGTYMLARTVEKIKGVTK